MKKIFGITVIVLLGGFLLIQLIPYGHQHTNPAVQQEPNWQDTQTRDLVSRACFDCHSNETKWPWYSNIAPVSWLVQRDVQEGRQHLNFSDWNQRHYEVDEVSDRCRKTVSHRWYPFCLSCNNTLSLKNLLRKSIPF